MINRLFDRLLGLLLSPWVLAAILTGIWLFTWNDSDAFIVTDYIIQSWENILSTYFLWFFAVLGFRSLRPETEFAVDSDLRTAVEDIISEADASLYLISPYLDPGNNLVESVLEARRRGAEVKLLYNSHQVLKPKVVRDIHRLLEGGVEVYTHNRLHSKLYVNESSVLISSLNLVAASYTESFEAGVISDDPQLYNSSRTYIETRLFESDLCSRITGESLPPSNGFCICTKKDIPFDRQHPVEYGEFKSKGGAIKGKYCHSCSTESETTIANPFCTNCEELHSMGKSSLVK